MMRERMKEKDQPTTKSTITKRNTHMRVHLSVHTTSRSRPIRSFEKRTLPPRSGYVVKLPRVTPDEYRRRIDGIIEPKTQAGYARIRRQQRDQADGPQNSRPLAQ